MAMLSLKVSIQEHGITKTIQFDRSMKTRDACKVIRDKMQEVPLGPEKDYGLFLSDEDQKKGVWLEMDYSLEHYLLRNGDMLVYKRKMRTLKVRMLDGSVKTVRVDDAQPVRKLMQVICTKIGITNHDEYSLVRETQEENKEPSYGTLTLRRDKNKMEQLKKKLKTDDDMNWVDHSKTLREQGIDEEENLLLRRKYFFSDHNVDSRDPIQLNLLYVQARDAILNGAHPVTVEQALQFGGIQCQIQFGDYNESKHKPGLFDLKDFLPKDFYKNKGIAKKVFAEHKKFSGLPEIEAKVQYVTLARSLKTYGVTFFLVKEQRKNKSKLVPRLLGVTKDSVLRLDEKTKEILETWPLTRVRKWAASPNSFTLDFGDYSDSYYSVQTPEGEQISQLIAGYIDIIIKKQRSNDHMGIEGDEGSTMVEDNVTPAKATILQQNPGARLSQISTGSIALPAVIRVGANGAQTPGLGQVQPVRFGDVKNQAHSVYAPVSPQHSRVHSAELSEPQRAYMSLIDSGQEAVEAAQKELESKQPELESENSSIQWKQNTLDVKRQTVSSQIAAMNAATAQVITYTSVPPEEVDHPAVGAAISTIATNLPEMSKDVKMMASLMEEDSGDRLLDAARGLCVAFSELLRAAEPEEPRQGLLAAATRVGEASHALLYTIGEEPEGGQEVVMGLAKAVSNAAASLVLQAKAIATRCVEHPEPQSAVIHSATQFALATSQLVACSQVIAPTITNRVCRHQLLEAAQEVAHAMEGVVVACQESGVPDERQDVRAAADNVNSALQGLQDHVISLSAESPQEDVVEKIFTTSNRVTTAAGDTGEMMRQAHCLAKATSELITTMKGEADMVGDNDMRNRIMSAARILADATTRLLDAAKGCSNNPKDEDCQVALHRAVEDVCQATSGAASAAFKRKLIRKLENAAKETCSAATQTIAAAKGASVHLTNAPSSDELLESCMEVAAMIPKVIQGVKATMADVDSVPAQMALIKSSLAFVQPCQRMVLASRGSLASVNSPPHRLHLANACTTQEDRLAALLEALERAQGACSALEIERALAAIQEISEDLKQWKDQLEKGELKPLEGDSPENTAALMGASCRSVGSAMVQLLTAANQGQESTTGVAARDTARHLKGLAQACRAVAATGNEPAPLDCAEEAMACSKDLVSAAQAALEERPGDPSRLTAVARSVSTALSDCLSCLPALRQLDRALAAVAKSGQQLATSQQHFPTSNKPYSELQTNLNTAAASLNDSAARLVEDAPTSRLATTAEDFGRSYENLMDCGLEMAGSTVNPEVQGQVVVSLRDVSIVSSKLLSAAKLTAADPTAPFSHNQLAAAARSVTDAINQLVDVCTCAGPGQKECDNAIRKIQSMRPLLDNLSEPVRDASYFECLDSVLEQSKVLGEAMASIVSSHVKPEPLAHGVKTMASAICELIEAGVQAGYLIGIAEPGSVPGRPGLMDPAQLARASQAVHAACQQMVESKEPQIHNAANVIAKHTSVLCNSSRVASFKTTDAAAKSQFIYSAKEVASTTASLVHAIRALGEDPSDRNRQNLQETTKPLFVAIDKLIAYASAAEFATIPAKLSEKARHEQQPIMDSGLDIIEGSCNMIGAAKSLVVEPKEPLSWKALSENSKKVSDAIITLVAAIKDHSPGQKECDDALKKLGQAMQLLSQGPCVNGGPPPCFDKSIQDRLQATSAEILRQSEAICKAAKSEPQTLANSVKCLSEQAEPLARAAVLANDPAAQHQLPDLVRPVLESSMQLLVVAKETGGNPRSSHLHGELDQAMAATKAAVQELLSSLAKMDSSAKHIDSLSQALNKMEIQPSSPKAEKSFSDFGSAMTNVAKEIAKTSQEMASKSGSSPSDLNHLAQQLCGQFSQLAALVPGCLATCSSPELGNKIKESMKELGQACQGVVKATATHLTSPAPYTQQALADSSWAVAERVSQLLSALSAGSRGLQACDNAASTVSGIIGDLDTTILFATAGTLHPDTDQETFSDHREALLQTAEALVADTKMLVSGAHAGQEQLAVAAQSAVSTIVQLTEVVKLGAASLGTNNTQSQVLLINAVKDVASSLGDLIQATKSASLRGPGSTASALLNEQAKSLLTIITSLLKTVKAVEDEHSRGTRALESTTEALNQEIRAYTSQRGGVGKTVTPEELVRVTKPVTVATARTVAAGTSCKQDDAIVAANMSRRAFTDLLLTCKAASQAVEEPLKSEIYEAGQRCAVTYYELLQQILQVLQKPSLEGRQRLADYSRSIAQTLADIVNLAKVMKGSDYVDPEDPTAIAESELIFAANSIDAAAKKLESFRPRHSLKHTTDESQNFDEMILEAARAIATATSALMRAATDAQRDLVQTGKASVTTSKCWSDDGQWSEGLISAARLVSGATHSLVEAANQLVQGKGGSRERLVSAARQVAASTAQLLVACQVRAKPNSVSMRRLQAAGNAVKKATDNLVQSAQRVLGDDVAAEHVELSSGMVGGIAQEIVAREEILRKERELQEARNKLEALRRAKYHHEEARTNV